MWALVRGMGTHLRWDDAAGAISDSDVGGGVQGKSHFGSRRARACGLYTNTVTESPALADDRADGHIE